MPFSNHSWRKRECFAAFIFMNLYYLLSSFKQLADALTQSDLHILIVHIQSIYTILCSPKRFKLSASPKGATSTSNLLQFQAEWPCSLRGLLSEFLPSVPPRPSVHPAARLLLGRVQSQPAHLPALGPEERRRDGAAEVVHRPVRLAAQPPAGHALPLRFLL